MSSSTSHGDTGQSDTPGVEQPGGPTAVVTPVPGSDPDRALEHLDPDAATRQFKRRPIALLVSAIAVALALYHMYTAYFGGPPTLIHRNLHVSVILALCFLLYPPFKRARTGAWVLIDVVLAVLALVPTVYVAVNYQSLVLQGGRGQDADILVGTLLIVLVLEAARRVTGWALPVLGILFLLYGLYGRDLPSVFRHRGYDWDSLAYSLYATTEGVFGTAIGVSATYIILFIIFGAVLAKSGMGQFFSDLAMVIAGRSRGGPAKVATLASGFLGSINGSAIANVVTTGSFTIPLMRRVGYTRTFAGAVESTASVGGQLLPPIMGAAAFIMAETLGIPYSTVALTAIIPALLYYLCLIAQIHLRATRDGLKGISKENLPAVMEVLKERGHLMVPLVFLLYMLFFSGRTILYSALLTIIVTLVVSTFRKTTRMSFPEALSALGDGARQSISVAVACAAVGIIVGVVSLSGFGVTLASAIVNVGGGSLFLTLFFTMLACLVLGMGLPSIPTYIVTATMAAPALTQLGVEPLVAHLFVFYFGLFANITPPVALASFAAAGLTGGSPMRTGFASMRLAAAGYVVPYVFVYSPDLLLRGISLWEGLPIIVMAVIGVLLLSVALEGHFMIPVHWALRILLAVGAVLVMTPDLFLDLIGGAIVLAVLGIVCLQAKSRDRLALTNI
jgi:TRAP transporter 4TM/12TM fusion protein